MAEQDWEGVTIDIRRADGVTLRCPRCGMTRELPADWQAIMRALAGPDWDGVLRCRNGHDPEAMEQLPGSGDLTGGAGHG